MKNKLWKTMGALSVCAALALAAAGCAAKPADAEPSASSDAATAVPTEVIDASDIQADDGIPEEPDSETIPVEEEPVEESTGYMPGTYTGEGTGKNGPIKVEVTVDESRIIGVSVVEQQETEGVADPALEQLPGAILAAQSADVDAVAGATLTSDGIIDAVNAALEQAAS